MTARDRWIDEGMTALREGGAANVRVDRIAASLGLTKGSFHHHFRGVNDFHRALLRRYELDSKDAIEGAARAGADLPAEQALMALPTRVALDPRLEAAIRGWALENEEAGSTQARVDSARLDALVDLWQRILPDPARARTAALVPHLLTIGASVAKPTLTQAELDDVFALLVSLVPAVR